ncbi:MAG: DUF2961 domain-containing protein [Clostridiaceae bacterium]|nr:DUF2961 domain-containing protein [Clostridiaceae bacterium]
MLHQLTKKCNIRTFSISPENFTGEKGKGGMAVVGVSAERAKDLGRGWKISPFVKIKPGEKFVLATVSGSGAVRHMWFTYSAPAPRDLILRFYWDGQEQASVEVPLGDFFASATKEYRQISSLPVCVNPQSGLNCYWEMPYRTGFRATLENRSDQEVIVFYQLDCEEKTVDSDALYFHAQFRRVNPLPYKQVYTILDGVTGKGQYVGTYLYWGVNSNGWWGEGEVKFYIDGDTDFPTICGTGTEDYFGGSYCFGVNGSYIEYSTPYSGLSKVDTTDILYRANRRFNMYRWHIQDPVYFDRDIRVTVQALGWRSGQRYLPLQDDISSVAFWYSDNLQDVYPVLQDRDYLEII